MVQIPGDNTMRKRMNNYGLCLALLFTTSLYSQQFSRMEQVVNIAESGDAEVHVLVSFTSHDTLESLQLACAFDAVSDIRATLQSDDSELPVIHMLQHDVPYIQVKTPILPGNHVISLEVVVDDFLDWDAAGPEEFGTYEWEMTYENNQPISIDSSSLTVKLPEGWNFHRIINSAPEFKKKDPKPPYTFSRIGDQASVTISRDPLNYRDELGVEFTFKQEKKGSVLIYVGLVIALLYLYYFKDLILKHRPNDKTKSDVTSDEAS